MATFYRPIPRRFGIPASRSSERLESGSFKEIFLRWKRQLPVRIAHKTAGALIQSRMQVARDVRGACVHKANHVIIEAVQSRLEPIAIVRLFTRGCGLRLCRNVIFCCAHQAANDIDKSDFFALLLRQSGLVLWPSGLLLRSMRGAQPPVQSKSGISSLRWQLRGQVVQSKRRQSRCVKAVLRPNSWRNGMKFR